MAQEATKTARAATGSPTPDWKRVGIRVLATAVALITWFWTQSLIGARHLPDSGIGDGLLSATAAANYYLHIHTGAANALLIVSSAFIDLMALFLLGEWIFRARLRPFLALVVVMGLRQMMEALVALPAPPGTIWHYPGFPSLLVTYSVGNDYFFSGHTAIAVLAAIEVVKFGRKWATAVAIAVVIFEIATVIVLRAHYTMDVVTGALAAFVAWELAQTVSARWLRA